MTGRHVSNEEGEAVLDRRTLVASSVAATATLAVSPSAIAAIPSSSKPQWLIDLAATRPVKRFRWASGRQELPSGFSFLEVVSRADGTPIEGPIVEANADEGWVEVYVDNPDGSWGRDANGYKITKRIPAEIEIISGPKFPPRWNDANSCQDIEAGCIYDEDLTDDERSWLANGKPYCAQCERSPIPQPNMVCYFCEPKPKETL